jgi:ABC-type sugar transport system ATPase subunit
VTHDQIEAMTLGDRIVVLDRGSIQQIDTPEGIYKRPANLMVAGFVGTPAMNFVAGQVTAGQRQGTVQFTSPGMTVEVAGDVARPGNMVLGIRPEQITVAADGTIEGTVQFIEDTGPERFLHVTLKDNEKFVVRVASTESHSLGETVALSIDPQQAHLFEAP